MAYPLRLISPAIGKCAFCCAFEVSSSFVVTACIGGF